MTRSPRNGPGQPVVDRWLLALVALALRRPLSFVAAAIALFAVAVVPAFRLYANLRTDLRELLPQGAPAAVALDALEQRVGGFSHLSIVIDTADLSAGERFVDALGARINSRLVPALAREVRYRNDDERAFLETHGALYADESDLRQLRDGLRAAVARARQRANPFLVELEEAPPIVDRELRATLERLRAAARREDRFLDGYLAGEGGRTLVLIVTPSDPVISLEGSRRLFDAVDSIVRDLQPRSFHSSIRVGYDGEVRALIEAQEHLVRDLQVSSVLVLLAVAAAILLYYRSLRALPLLTVPLMLGVVVTFALSSYAIGHLNPNTAFLGGIIIGNGINPGIILLARYLEERRRGAHPGEALSTAMTGSWRATLAASAAAAASYASLGVTRFRGFNQFAFMGAAGMVLTWLSTYLLMPPLLVIAERLRPLVDRRSRRLVGGIAERFAQTMSRQRRLVIALSVLACVVSCGLLLRFSRDPIEYNFERLGSRQGRVDGAAYWSRRLDAVMGSYITPTVVLAETSERAAAIARALREQKQAEGAESTIANVIALGDLLPSDQPRKLALLRDIREALSDQVLDALDAEARAFVDKLRTSTLLREVTLSDVPPRLTRSFREKGGAEGRLVLVYPTLVVSAEHGQAQLAFARSVRAAVKRADPAAHLAGSLILSADIIESITRDGAAAASLSFLGVALLTLIVLASLRSAAWVLGSLAIGALWMGGLLGALGLKLNFVNFVVLPITFGIGVDYAVNLYQRYRQSEAEGLVHAVAAAGGAVVLCSATTIIGYAALLLADNQAIHSFGLTAVLGEITCLSAAVVLLPAALVATRRLARRP